MHGSLSTEKKVNVRDIVNSQQFRMLLVSMSVGVMAGLFVAVVRLHLGMPGHKAFLWMTPVLIARLRGGCKIGTTAGGLFAALTVYSMGANLAGGLIGMPLIVLSGMILDWAVNSVEKKKASVARMILMLGLAGVAANLVCLLKRMILPTGLSPHLLFGVSGFWFKLFSYAFFGCASGVVASVVYWFATRKKWRGGHGK